MTNLEIIALSITAEYVQVDSENLFWSKKNDYGSYFNRLAHRTKFNKRRKRLVSTMNQCLNELSDLMSEQVGSETLIVDSMPIITCRIVREKILRLAVILHLMKSLQIRVKT